MDSLVMLSQSQGGFVFMRLRKRRLAKPNRAWLNRPGGWAQDGYSTERGIPSKGEALINHINLYPNAISRRLNRYVSGVCRNEAHDIFLYSLNGKLLG
jgi:hypothetical protein